MKVVGTNRNSIKKKDSLRCLMLIFVNRDTCQMITGRRIGHFGSSSTSGIDETWKLNSMWYTGRPRTT